jgi:hypothetical protein
MRLQYQPRSVLVLEVPETRQLGEANGGLQPRLSERDTLEINQYLQVDEVSHPVLEKNCREIKCLSHRLRPCLQCDSDVFPRRHGRVFVQVHSTVRASTKLQPCPINLQ